MSKNNYNALVKAELVGLLNERDTEISTLRENPISLSPNQNENENIINDLQEQLQVCQDSEPIVKTAEELIKVILSLPEEEVQLLPSLIRTTDKGIEAYAVFNYGALPALIAI